MDLAGGRPLAWSRPAAAVAALAAIASCAYDFGGVTFDDAPPSTSAASGSTSAGGSSGSAGGGTSTGSGGGPVACGDVECPVVECYATSCEGSSCVLTPREAGAACGPSGDQTCDDALTCVGCTDDDDCAEPLTSCRTVSCDGGQCEESAVDAGERCDGEDGVCTADQVCVACVEADDCEDDEVCIDATCATPAPSCGNGSLDDGEASVDCGGVCPRCENGQECTKGDACVSGYCDGECAPCALPAHCPDVTWCSGGVCVPRKSDGVPCGANGECSSGACVEGVCCDGPCDGTCRSCRSSLTAFADGVCAAILVGEDPDDECETGDCRTGTCDGTGECGTRPGECPGTCQIVEDVAYAAPGVCHDGECTHPFNVGCGEGSKCNPEGTACVQ